MFGILIKTTFTTRTLVTVRIFCYIPVCNIHFTLCFKFQLAQPIRLLLTYAGVEFEDVQYGQGPRKNYCYLVLRIC
jgi:hypothetical protein